MEKISIQEISAVLIEKFGLKKREAEIFVTTMFDLVKEGLINDRIVKIKGLGTFKIIDIEARESVNVNTGERVLIEGHDKITFTPDATMKELVNKPFSQFETVVLNDGVDFDDMKDEPQAESVQPVEPEIPVEPVAEPEIPEEPVAEPEIPVEPVVEPEIPVDDEPEQAIETFTEEFTNEEPEFMTKRQSVIGLCWAIVACILCFAAGYYVRELVGPSVPTDTITAERVDVKPDSAAAAEPIVKKDTIAKQEAKPVAEKVAAEPAKPAVEPSKPAAEPAKPVVKETKQTAPQAETVQSDKYEKMDARVRTGAYRIVGTDHTEKVRAGDNTAKIARRTLGPDMECYIEVYNGLSSGANLTEGQQIKIPKLELKKKKSKQH